MSRTLTLELPEAAYRALERHATSKGQSPETAGATVLIDGIGRLSSSPGAGSAGPARAIAWEGPQLSLHSLAQVNREFCLRLIERGHELTLIPPKVGDAAARPFAGGASLEARFHRSLGRPADVHVSHRWPPSFEPPPDGHWVIIQPWEFGSLPRSWIGPMSDRVDEVWAYTRFVRDSYVASGVPEDRVHVVPLGVDPRRFHPGAEPYPLRTTKPFRFLFVGGTIHRKGIDALLKAYTETFTARDPVCLVIKDMGGASFYRGQTSADRIRRIQERSDAPEIEYLDQDLDGDELAGLYTACDCLVHPYRGEGFGLPIAEAMASGLPVIVTGSGAALDYCTEENAFLIPARIVHFREKRIGGLETVDYPYLAEPDPDALRDYLRTVVDHPAEARARGRAAGSSIRQHLTWDRAVDAIEGRLEHLRGSPIRRFARPRGPATTTRQSVSLCMIVKDEEAHLADCLNSVADLVDEIVVVDTGSTDATAAVAARCGARVHPFRWVDSFAEARNESLCHARTDWIFWLDGDERLDEVNRSRLRTLLAGLRDENAAYLMQQRSPARPGSAEAIIADQVRLFRRLPEVRWSYRVHEQILPSLRRSGVDLRRSDVVIQHAGHEDAALRDRKLERDLRLLTIENNERPDDPFILFNLGALHHERDRPAEALPFLQRSLERSRPRDSIVPKLHALIVGCHRKLRRPAEALEACRAGRRHDAGNVELLFLEALLRREVGDPSGAEGILRQLLAMSPTESYANGDDGLRGYKARHNLAVIYEESGRPAEAEAQWRAAVAENPRFATGWTRLGELYLKQRRWDELEEAARGLAACPSSADRANGLRERARRARLASSDARSGLAARPRVSLCMIVKDEEAVLGTCLASVADLVDEMIVVDTGSTDRTRDVAMRAGARVIDFAWVDDFAAARNASIEHATGDWIFWLDADERLDAVNRETLRALFAGLDPEGAAYLMQQLSTTDDPHGSRVAVDQVRLFRRDPALRWEYRVHEQILLAIRRAGHDLRRTDVIIGHDGYRAADSSHRKVRRNLALLLRQDADRPDDPITLYHLGQVYQRLGRAEDALPILRRSLELTPPDFSIRPRLYAMIARVHETLGRVDEALAVCRAGREVHPDLEELLFLEAALLHGQGDAAGAEERLLRLLRTPTGRQLAAGDAGRRTYKARHLLAEVYRSQGRPTEAEAQWRLVVAEQPRFGPAWQSLVELYRDQGRIAERDEAAIALVRTTAPEPSDRTDRAREVPPVA